MASTKAASLTRQMLAYAGRGHVEIDQIQVSTIIRDIERLVRSALSKNVELRVDLAADLPLIKADAAQMQQVMMNLAMNAREAMPSGGQLQISTSNAAIGGAGDGATGWAPAGGWPLRFACCPLPST